MADKPFLKVVPSDDLKFKSSFMNAKQVKAVQLMKLLGMSMAHATAFAQYSLDFPANDTFMYQDHARSTDPNVYIHVLEGSILIGKITNDGDGFDEYLEIKSMHDDPGTKLDKIIFPLDIKKNIFTVKAGPAGALVLMFRTSNFLESLKKMPSLLPEGIKSQERLFQKLMIKRAPKIGYTLEAAALFQIGYMMAKTISNVIQQRDSKNTVWLYKKIKEMLHDYFVMNNPNRADETSELEFFHEIIASIFTRK
jgi:hypothetical protein